jgi:anti-sigma B factor antagonist
MTAYSTFLAGGVCLFSPGQLQMRRVTVTNPSCAVARLQMSGEFDISNKDSLGAILLQGESADYVIIDMSDTTYIDSSALHCLVHLKKRLMARGEGAIHLLGVRPNIRKLFTVTGLDALFEING